MTILPNPFPLLATVTKVQRVVRKGRFLGFNPEDWKERRIGAAIFSAMLVGLSLGLVWLGRSLFRDDPQVSSRFGHLTCGQVAAKREVNGFTKEAAYYYCFICRMGVMPGSRSPLHNIFLTLKGSNCVSTNLRPGIR